MPAIRAWHDYADGATEEAEIIRKRRIEDFIRVRIAVPGFSSYGLRD